MTTLGRIDVFRSYCQHRSGGNSIFPLDEKLGVEGEILMPDVKEIVLFSCAYNTPEETSRLLDKCSFIKIHPTQIKRAITSTNEFLEAPNSDIMDNVRQNEAVPISEIMVCSLDGVNVLLNKAGKKMGKPTERPTKERIPSSRIKMQCAVVFLTTIRVKKMRKKYLCGLAQSTLPGCLKIVIPLLNVNLKRN